MKILNESLHRIQIVNSEVSMYSIKINDNFSYFGSIFVTTKIVF